MDILTSIVAATDRGLDRSTSHRDALERLLAELPEPPSFRRALRAEKVAVIAEIKRRSPSAGAINPNLSPVTLARSYQQGGAAAISVLTEGPHFGGSLADLEQVNQQVSLPTLRKDFIIDRIQLLEARVAGAAAVLLIVRSLPQPRLITLLEESRALGLDTLVETHDAEELRRAIDAGADVIGVNARNLNDFSISQEGALRLIEAIPAELIGVAESGMSTADDVQRAAAAGADAVLIGGALASAADPVALARELSAIPRRSR